MDLVEKCAIIYANKLRKHVITYVNHLMIALTNVRILVQILWWVKKIYEDDKYVYWEQIGEKEEMKWDEGSNLKIKPLVFTLS